ncbi:UvrD-helicase domain-containing protein [Arthrobacter alpinus]|uniref:UvrD-helicase domain-containing protein n=1 Tax=Arthrobacter alpinus TaxID=656366 RepID=UPI001644B239|nr:UvrD-helicase domain-containing protein [Arthrobacter alpinus]
MRLEIQLDESQKRVVGAAAHARQFVVAAAGQGKTEVVLSRIEYLVADEGMNPADEILVLSFSRAAIEAVRKRAHAFELESVGIRTFDSLAAQIVLDEEGPDAWQDHSSFNGRIRRATELVASTGSIDRIDHLRHLIIDEAQDLVGDRAELVMSILDRAGEDLGITVLGDPLQGIYDFQLDGDDSVSKISSTEFIDRLENGYRTDRVELEHHYRAQSESTKELIGVGNSIRALDLTDPANVELGHRLLDDWSRDEGMLTSFLDERGALEPSEGESTALLCSTNYEVLIASQLLWEQGIGHVVRRRAQDMGVAPWVHLVFKDLEGRSYDKDEILERLEAAGLDSAEDRWADLKACEGDSRAWHSLDVARLANRLRSDAVPFSLTVSDNSLLTISTVHRAKGLEFTNVLYVPPNAKQSAGQVNISTLHQKYVALTRARQFAIAAPIPKDKGSFKISKMSKTSPRWLEEKLGKGQRRYVDRIEFINSDVDDTMPIDTETNSAQEIQSTLARNDISGQAVLGKLDPATKVTDLPRYILSLESGEIIGRTSSSFAAALKSNFYGVSMQHEWPGGFTGSRVTAVECATGRPEDTQFAGLGHSGMWLVPRLTGLITRERNQ